MRKSRTPLQSLRLRVGEVVEVRSREEIISTLAEDGTLDAMPFMPEMLAFSGKRFTVEKRAHKTCDTVESSGLRSVDNAVHLSGTRCDGSAHGGCAAQCQLFWKESWLKRVENDTGMPTESPHSAVAGIGEDRIYSATTQATPEGETGIRYRCQATDLRRYSRPLSAWNLQQYWLDVWSGNASVRSTLRALGWRFFVWAQRNLRGYNLQRRVFNHLQRWRGGVPVVGLAGPNTRTPKETLGLAVGECVEVKSREKITATLDKEQRNRGLYFDYEMTPFCNRTYRVTGRVSEIIEEKTGRMVKLPGDCITLDGVVCTGRYHANCPRAIPPYWREIWLQRIDGATTETAGDLPHSRPPKADNG